MPFSPDFPHIPTASIWVDEEARQRSRGFGIEDLEASVQRRGIMMPLIVEKRDPPCEGNWEGPQQFKLVAGERRLATAIKLGIESVPYRLVTDLSPDESKIIEFEENVKRRDLKWQDEALAVLDIHEFHTEREEQWSSEKTAGVVNLSVKYVQKLLAIASELKKGDASIASAEGIGQAVTILNRRNERQRGEALNSILRVDAGAVRSAVVAKRRESGEEVADEEEEDDEAPAVETKAALCPHRIECIDAIDWMASYSDEPFNFLHVDFPYGVKLNEQANQESFETGYDSDVGIYWTLCKALAEAFPRLVYPSAHIMFWFAFEATDGQGRHCLREETLDFFETHPNTRHIDWQRVPLIWHKTDNRGIISDPMRRPRNIGEYAMIGAASDRHLVKPKGNIYGAPTDKASSIHTNEKPEPMLRHFFEMFVDGHSRVLDPTCGSGSSIRAAESLGAECALGIERDPELARRAENELLKFRTLRSLSNRYAGVI